MSFAWASRNDRETTQDMDAVYAELEDAAEEPARRASR